MSDVINLTITNEEEVFNISIQDAETYTINFLEVASIDPRVAAARDAAEAAQAAAEEASVIASTYATSSILNALIFG